MPSNCTGSAWHCCPAVLRATLACRRRPGLPAGYFCHVDNFLPLYASRARCVDLRVGWIGCMPGMRPAAVCQHFMTGERHGPFSSLILARFALYCHPDLLTSRSETATCWFMPARCVSDSGKACLTFPFVSALQRVLCKTRLVYTKHCSSPRIKMSFGRFLPINTILLPRTSFSPHLAPRSLPISWCTPWKTTLRSAPCISSTPL